ncbi:MAG: TetR/AcrR family transcriptional regulator [Janthinobacterium lividum]
MRTRDTEKEALVKQHAVELLALSGFEGFSMNKLAKRCAMSVATLYIYYRDKDDLIVQIGREQVHAMRQAEIVHLDPNTSFAQGLRTQWHNRYSYLMANPLLVPFFEQLRSSSYQAQVYTGLRDAAADVLQQFRHQAVARGELAPLAPVVYWALAFAPLQALLRAHHEGKGAGNQPFVLTEALVWQAFELVLKALQP